MTMYFSNTGTILEVPYEKGMRDEVSIPYNPLATVSLSAEEVSCRQRRKKDDLEPVS